MIRTIQVYFLLLFGFLLIVTPIILFNYLQDPYAIFIKVVDENTEISNDFRYSFPNVAKKMDFDTAIVGTSDSLPYSQTEVKSLIQGSSFNFAIKGATNYEQSLLVKSILENKPNALVIWQINWLSFLWVRDHSRIGNDFPLYLYEKDNFDLYFKSLLNPFNAFKSLSSMNKINSVTKISNLGSWEDSSEEKDFSKSFEIRKIDFFDFINKNKNIREFEKKELDFQFDSYIASTVSEYQGAEFIIVLPPFHYRFLNEIKSESPLLYNQFTHFNLKATELANKFNNVKLVNFNEKCNFQKRDEIYKDLFHFKNKYAKFFIKEILRVDKSRICP
jgi:hypothetical protein